jgi:hypothetical protein
MEYSILLTHILAFILTSPAFIILHISPSQPPVRGPTRQPHSYHPHLPPPTSQTRHRRPSLSLLLTPDAPPSPPLLHSPNTGGRGGQAAARGGFAPVLGSAARGSSCAGGCGGAGGGAEARGGVEVLAEELAPGLEVALASLSLDR